jgi:hypothetical protein
MFGMWICYFIEKMNNYDRKLKKLEWNSYSYLLV